MKRIDFHKNEQFMAELAELLRTPVLAAAIEIVKTESVGLPDAVPGVEYQTQVAVAGAFTAGIFKAFERLESLARPLTIGTGVLPRQNQYDDAAKARMRAAGVYTEAEIGQL